MSTDKWLVIGVSGVTCGGKSLMARKLHSLLPGSKYLGLDRYFLHTSDSRHQKAPGVEHINWEIPSALDFEAWQKSVQHILDGTEDNYTPCLSCPDDDKLVEVVEEIHPTVSVPQLQQFKVLILDGFLIFNDQWTSELCDLKFYFTLTREQCLQRRNLRNYDPPDVPGYFEACVWPEHVKWKNLAMEMNPDMIVMDGFQDRILNLNGMLETVSNRCLK